MDNRQRELSGYRLNQAEESLEVAKNCCDKGFYKDSINHFDSISIENSCDGSGINTSKIFKKDFSTKPQNSGLGLWKVKKILKHYDNIKLNTSVKKDVFRQQLQIYY